MKKILLTILLGAASVSVFSQDKPAAAPASTNSGKETRVSLVFSPNMTWNRATSEKGVENETYKTSGVGVRYRTGINVDFHFGQNASFTTGLFYLVKRANFQVNSGTKDTTLGGDYKYNLQYLQVPLTLKMFTNNIADDFKLYFQLGPTLDFKINEKRVEGDVSTLEAKNVFLFFDAGLMAGAGVEWQLGSSTAAFFGLSYNRSLLNGINPLIKYNKIPSNQDPKLVNHLNMKTDFISLDLGVKF